MLVSTYQHDYVPPNAKRYEFLRGKASKDAADSSAVTQCQCAEPEKIQTPLQASKDCNTVEWTGIAPMGKLVDPRLIPTKLSKEQSDNLAIAPDSDCFKMQPNRFLKILRTTYPDLYERLKVMPKEELSRRLERNRMYTTYQIDYCNMNEYPEGVYESLKTEDESSKINASKLLKPKAPCSEFRANVMQEMERDNSDGSGGNRGDGGGNGSNGGSGSDGEAEKAYKPFKTTFSDSSRMVDSGNNSHWRASPTTFRKQPNFTEYMDSISRNGCIIMRNRLHDHSKCLDNYCRHELKFTCKDMKQ